MAFDVELSFPDDSRSAKLIRAVADRLQITTEEAARRVFEDGLSVQCPEHARGDLWGLGEQDAEALDEIVQDAMAERRIRGKRRSDA